jgi:hypothetical protein
MKQLIKSYSFFIVVFLFCLVYGGLSYGVFLFLQIFGSLNIALLLMYLYGVLFLKKIHLKQQVVFTGLCSIISILAIYFIFQEESKAYFMVMLGVFMTISILLLLTYKFL